MDKLNVFYDGQCKICQAEMRHYMECDDEGLFNFIDITKDSFEASKYRLNANEVHDQLHVQIQGGATYTGVDSLVEIWRRIPRYKLLAWPAQLKIIRPFLDLGYSIFSTLRPYLPKNNCPERSCK